MSSSPKDVGRFRLIVLLIVVKTSTVDIVLGKCHLDINMAL